MDRSSGSIHLASGSKVFLNQAFTCCPYAAVITSKIHDFFEANRCEIVDEPADAVLSVVNTCGFNASRSTQAIKTIGVLRKMAPDSPLVVAGCLTRIEEQRVAEALAGAPAWLLVGPNDHRRFDELLPRLERPFAEVQTNLYKDRYSSRDPRFGLYQVLVSIGCMNQCAYCVIRQAKGPVTSKPLEEVCREVERGFELGYRDIFLVGDDIASWGHDLGTDVVELLRALASIGTEGQYSAEAFEPSRLMPHLDALEDVFRSGRFAWLVVPVQSGSDRLLRAMGRGYTRADAERLVRRLKETAPEMILSTDFIFGFAEETRAEFDQSIELAQRFDYANFNEYEPRPGTPPLLVPESEMEHRRQVVMEFLREQGSQVEVLTRNRNIPCEALMGAENKSVGKVEPSPWVVEHAAVLQKRFEGDASELAEGWRVVEVKEDYQRVVLVVGHDEADEPLEFLVAERDPDTPCIAFSVDYNFGLIWEKESACTLDAGQIKALEALKTRLDLQSES
ncbi:MAG: radical SAM protein [Deltaproteobacteria bacterium]|nr:radical SAM protein [Deltaproteobacteria bacterium]MBW2533148.1 radical SAM protein [Deltaproteobacteria bacterium]